MDPFDALDVLPFSLGRILNAAIMVGLLAVIPAALIAGSGGSGGGFDALTFGAIVAASAIVAGVIAGVTAPRARRRPGDEDQELGSRR